MRRANINDRASIERIYPRAVFAHDANANMRAKASVLAGVRIASAPDAAGDFDLIRATRHAGETAPDENALFLCPFAQKTAHGDDYPATAASESGKRGDDGAYDAFIDEIISRARSAHFPERPGPQEARLRGLRQ